MRIIQSNNPLPEPNGSMEDLLETVEQHEFQPMERRDFDGTLEALPFVIIGLNAFSVNGKRADDMFLQYRGQGLTFASGDTNLKVTTSVERYMHNDTVFGREENGRRIYGSTNLWLASNWGKDIKFHQTILNPAGKSQQTLTVDTVTFLETTYAPNGWHGRPVSYGTMNEANTAGIADFRFNHVNRETPLVVLEGEKAQRFIDLYIARKK